MISRPSIAAKDGLRDVVLDRAEILDLLEDVGEDGRDGAEGLGERVVGQDPDGQERVLEEAREDVALDEGVREVVHAQEEGLVVPERAGEVVALDDPAADEPPVRTPARDMYV